MNTTNDITTLLPTMIYYYDTDIVSP